MVRRAITHPARALILAGAALAVAVVIVVAITVGGHARVMPSSSTAPLAIDAELTPATTGFGDRITARIVIAADNRAVRPQTLHYDYSLAPLTSLGPAQVSRTQRGALAFVTIVQQLVCVSTPCVSRKGPAAPALSAVHASVARLNGGGVRVSARWPTLSVRGRAVSSDLSSNSPNLAVDATPTQPSYRISPSFLATVLEVLGVIAGVGAVVLLSVQVHLVTRRRSDADADALTRAIELTREAQTMPAAQRRRAVGLLARVLSRGDLSSAASSLAWSEREPESDQLQSLAAAAEREAQ